MNYYQIFSTTLLFVMSLTLTSCGNNLSNYYLSKAKKLEDKEQYKEAIVLLNKAIEKNPKNLNAFINRGAYKSYLEDYYGAMDDFSKVIEMDTANALAYLNRGKSKAFLGNYREAIEDYDKIMKMKGWGGLFHLELVDNFFTKRKTSDFDVKREEVFLARGFARYDMDSLMLAFNDFSVCIQGNFAMADSYYMVGLIYLAYGDMENAYPALYKAEIFGNTGAREMINKYYK